MESVNYDAYCKYHYRTVVESDHSHNNGYGSAYICYEGQLNSNSVYYHSQELIDGYGYWTNHYKNVSYYSAYSEYRTVDSYKYYLPLVFNHSA